MYYHKLSLLGFLLHFTNCFLHGYLEVVYLAFEPDLYNTGLQFFLNCYKGNGEMVQSDFEKVVIRAKLCV